MTTEHDAAPAVSDEAPVYIDVGGGYRWHRYSGDGEPARYEMIGPDGRYFSTSTQGEAQARSFAAALAAQETPYDQP